MPIVTPSIEQVRSLVSAARRSGQRIGFVPTMGALHDGHLSLLRRSHEACSFHVVSIYVNPTQFGPQEDLDAYPRTLADDVDKLAAVGIDVVFTPDNAVMYPDGFQTWVDVDRLTQTLEGASRPTHFRGVTTVVTKLLNVVAPDVAFFGQKDYQQLAVIRRMVRDLDMPIEIAMCPIVREPDGLAMSSRNRYLSPAARRQAKGIYQGLQQAIALVRGGERDPARIIERTRAVIAEAGPFEIDYVTLVDPETLAAVQRVADTVLLAVAARIESTRLIDNAVIEVGA